MLSRQAELKALTRKYAADIDGVLAWAAAARERLGSLDVSDEALAALTARRDGLAVELAEHAAAVTAARTKAAGRLAADTTAELAGLAMADARLLVAVTQRVAAAGADGRRARRRRRELVAGPDGVDEVELRLVAARRRVAAAAAQGRVRRRAVAGDARAGGGARRRRSGADDGVRRGRRGRRRPGGGRDRAPARPAGDARHQVIVVTHLPQVAAYADRHLVVDKSRHDGGVARSRVRTLDEDERIVELARMLAGLDDTDTGRAHAEELLEAARAHRAPTAAPSPPRPEPAFPTGPAPDPRPVRRRSRACVVDMFGPSRQNGDAV